MVVLGFVVCNIVVDVATHISQHKHTQRDRERRGFKFKQCNNVTLTVNLKKVKCQWLFSVKLVIIELRDHDSCMCVIVEFFINI